MKKLLFISFEFLFILVLVFNFAWADEGTESKPKALQAVEFFTGYSFGNIKGDNQGKFEAVPLVVDLDFDLKPLTKKIGFNPSSLVQFQLEPFINYIYGPYANVETGVGLMFKFGLVPDTWKFQPYVKFGSAPSYISLSMPSQANGFNFISSGGGGFHYSINKNTATTLEYRYRHLSNAGMREPNSGLNTQVILAGIMRSF